MADARDVDATMGDDYNESEDSDFEAADAAEGEASSSEDDDAANDSTRPAKRRKTGNKESHEDDLGEMDSGDEATIAKAKRKSKKAGPDGAAEAGSDAEGDGWRAKTRAMREKEKDEKKRSKLASAQGSTVDVDSLWAEMMKPGTTAGTALGASRVDQENDDPASKKGNGSKEAAKMIEEMITIKRTYKFAGEVHTEEKTVPKSSAEARLWLAQQEAKGKRDTTESAAQPDAQATRRPLRRISRFDPNFNNLDAFKKTWTKNPVTGKDAKGPKLNVVEKSKMDWAAHVDTEGLKDELDLASRAKGGYLSRMDFLGEVESRREDEARKARQKG